MYLTSSAITLRAAKTILAAFSNALNKHMFCCVHHFVSFCPLLRYVLVILSYLVLVNCFIYHLEHFYLRRLSQTVVSGPTIEQLPCPNSIISIVAVFIASSCSVSTDFGKRG